MVTRWPLVGRDTELEKLRSLLDARHGPRGVAVFGGAGVGKSRLVAETLEACRESGTIVEWVRATEAARQLPLGSLAHLLAPGDEAFERNDLLHLALARLRERAAGDVVLAIDDAHLLDEVSVALLHLAVTQSPVKVLVSVRTGEVLPPGLVGLWKDELLVRHDVKPLGRDATEKLVLHMLGPSTPASSLDRAWRLSRGNPLFVRELVVAAHERQEAGAGDLASFPPAGSLARLHELVEERLRRLPARLRSALELVAVGEQVPLAAAERLVDPADLTALEEKGLVELVDVVELVDTDRSGEASVAGSGSASGSATSTTVQVAHPLYGEVLAAALPRLRRRALLRDLADAVEGSSPTPDVLPDRLRLATWRLESGAPGDPDQLVQLAREALGRLDHHLAERLALAAGGASRAEAGLVVAEALSGQGRMEEASATLAKLQPTEPGLVARVAVARASELFLHLGRSGEAFQVLQSAIAALDDHPAGQADCRSVLAQMHMFSLQLAEASQITEDLLGGTDPEVPGTARVRAAAVAVAVWGAQGRPDASLALVDDDVQALARRHRREVPYGDIQLRMARFQALWWAGRAHEMDAYTAANLGLPADPPPSLQGILAGFRGGALVFRGRPRAALVELQRSTRALAESDLFGQRPLAEAIRTRAAVFAGELATAAEALQAADAAYAADPQRSTRTLPHVELSRAWLVAAQGTRTDAADRCLALATMLEHVAKPLAVEALHAAVRLGRAREALDAVERVGEQVDGPLAPLVVQHAQALAKSDAQQLATVATGFEQIGADLLAAEALRSAANIHRREGRGASAAATARQADDLLERCGWPRSPALEPLRRLGEELTEREREVAMLAAGGRTSPEIARALYLSVRTVDTHLHRIYRKLMIDGRHQLREALGLPPDPPH